jgi:hypothetical protein
MGEHNFFDAAVTLPETLRFIGALQPPSATTALPEWADELDGKRRVVLVTQGTDAIGTLRCARHIGRRDYRPSTTRIA